MAGLAAYAEAKLQQKLRAPAHPIPPHPAYYAPPPPPPAPRRSCSGCWLCCLFIIIVVMLLVIATILACPIYRPGFVRATAVSATLSRFDLALADSPSGGGTIQFNLTVDLRVRNTNGFGINYEYTEAQASYDGERFGYDPVEPFYQEGKSERTITTAFSGSSPIFDGDAVRTFRRERSDGFYFVKVGLYPDMSFKLTRMSNGRRKCTISCTLRLPVPNTSAMPVTTQLGTKCAACGLLKS